MQASVATAALAFAAASFIPGAASAQGVTFDDLVGWRVSGSVVHAREVRTAAGQGISRITANVTFVALPGSKVRITSSVTATRIATGEPKTSSWNSELSLGKPTPFRDGTRVVIFDGGKFTILRTRDEGAQKYEFTFTKSGDKITCRVSDNSAREAGGRVVSTSSPWGGSAEILSNKQLSSSCSVTKA